MSSVKGRIEASISLSKSTCYSMLTGKCSLNIVSDYYISPSTRTSANELLYCPRLYRAMCHHERCKPITVTPCQCGHAEIISGHQRACIASQKNLELCIQPADPSEKANCPVCSNNITFEPNSETRIVSLRVSVNNNIK